MSAEVKARSNATPCALRRRPACLASSTPAGVRSTSRQPVKRFLRFHSLWPWRRRTKRRSLAGILRDLVRGFFGDSRSTHRSRRQPENRPGSFEMALPMGARGEDRLERRQARAGDGPDADRTIDLLDRLDDMD